MSGYLSAQEKCQDIKVASLENLLISLDRNNSTSINQIIQKLESACGESEFTQRISIINNIISRQSSDHAIKNYQQKKYDEILMERYDAAAKENYDKIYQNNPMRFEYIPFNHPIDLLIQKKAIALLESEHYKLSNDEIALLHLFSDNIQEYNRLTGKTPTPVKTILTANEDNYYKGKSSFGIHAGIFSPIGKNNYFGSSPTFGISWMGALNKKFVPEFFYKFRLTTAKQEFRFKYENSTHQIASKSSHWLAAGLGYKVIDKGKNILMPKLNVGYGFIWTSVYETSYSQDEEGNEVSTDIYRNVRTVHSSLGLAFLHRIKGKARIGTEINYHFAPYEWDKRLLSPIPSNYVSAEIFFRF